MIFRAQGSEHGLETAQDSAMAEPRLEKIAVATLRRVLVKSASFYLVPKNNESSAKITTPNRFQLQPVI